MPNTSGLPKYLQAYISDQHYESYTSRDHAAWRFIMRQSADFFKVNALPIYLNGLTQTGISTERIPRISEMNTKLNKFGWRAVAVTGFIPPAVFLDFQARKILPIACDMRSIDHIEYTPAPDIVHEAAGHAPIIVDPKYSEYLTKYASVAKKAIFAKEDFDLYDAIRALSDLKENPDSTPEEIAKAETDLTTAVSNVNFISEANKTARMNWWTVEYGLMGSVESPKIFGAGLLSSMGESQKCLGEGVKKIPLSIACIETTYDITEPQPQLFVARDVDHLIEVLEEMESKMSYKVGGQFGLIQAKLGRTVNTVQLGSGVQVTGVLVDFEHAGDRIDFIKFSGPVQICFEESELEKQGKEFHAEGFSSPIGPLKLLADKDPDSLTLEDLNSAGIETGSSCELEFVSGFSVKGSVVEILTKNDRPILIKWRDCQVTKGKDVYFEPSWGDFDMVLGGSVTSVFGGPADREHYGIEDISKTTTVPGRVSPYSKEELLSFELYSEIRTLRESASTNKNINPKELDSLKKKIKKAPESEWLLRFEFFELCKIFDFEIAANKSELLAFTSVHDQSTVSSLLEKSVLNLETNL